MSFSEQYDSLVSVRNVELQVYWTRYNVQVALNGGFLAAAFVSSRESQLAELPNWAVAIGGIALAVVWLLTVIQGKEWVHRWDQQLSAFEHKHEEEIYPLFSNVRRAGAAMDKWRNITALASIVPIVVVVAWGAYAWLGFEKHPVKIVSGYRLFSVLGYALAAIGSVLVLLSTYFGNCSRLLMRIGAVALIVGMLIELFCALKYTIAD